MPKQLFQMNYLLKHKNGIDKVHGKLDVNSNEVTLVLFNGRHGTDTDKVDSENKKIIDLLKTFDAKISKSPYHYSYWNQSLSHITLPYQKIENIIESLSLFEDVPLLEPRLH